MADIVIAPIWLGTNMVLAVATWRCARWLFPYDSPLEVLVHAVLLSWACIVSAATLLGVLFCLSGLSLLVVVAGISGSGLFFVERKRKRGSCNLVAMSTRDKLWTIVWLGLLGVWIGRVLTDGLWQFPIAWDALNYHLPIMNHWLQAGSLFARDCREWATPGNNEVFELWATGAFSGDFFAALSNLPSTALLGLSAVGLCLRIGLPTALSHLCALAVASNFIVIKQLTNFDTDVAVAGCFLAAVFYAVRFAHGTGHYDLLLGAISLGLLGGIKYYASAYAVLALGILVISATTLRGRRAGWHAMLAGLVGLFLWSGYWYIRNVFVTGSPMYPKQFFVSDDLLLQIYPDTSSSSFFGNGDPRLLALYTQAIWYEAGPCQFCGFVGICFSLPWLLIAGMVGFWRGYNARPALTRIVLALLLIGTGLLLDITPFAVEDRPGTLNQLLWRYCPVRYGTCFLTIATIALFVVMHDVCHLLQAKLTTWGGSEREPRTTLLSRCFFYLPQLVLGGAVLYQIYLMLRRLENGPWFNTSLIGINVALSIIDVTMMKAIWPHRWRTVVVMLVLASFAGTIWECERLSEFWHAGFAPEYRLRISIPYLPFLPTEPAEHVTICVLDWRYYPYFGSHRQYRVCQPIYVPSAAWIMDYLAREKVDFIVQLRDKTDFGLRRFAGAEGCFSVNPDLFRLLYEDESLSVYRFLREK